MTETHPMSVSATGRPTGVVALAKDFVSVQGPDALRFLQGQLSQNVDFAVDSNADSLLLSPQGKLVAFLSVLRPGDDHFVLMVDGGWGDAVIERLERFKLRVKCDVAPLAWRCLAVRGPRAHDLFLEPDPGRPRGIEYAGAVLQADWPGLDGVDLVGPDPRTPDAIVALDPDHYEAMRIEAGVPVMGRELTDATIPAEAGIVDRSASFTKGCYTGQELVARIDSRGGNVPRRLRGVVINQMVSADRSGEPPRLRVEGRVVGTITSWGWSKARTATVALAYVKRGIEPPADVEVTWGESADPTLSASLATTVSGRVQALPLIP